MRLPGVDAEGRKTYRCRSQPRQGRCTTMTPEAITNQTSHRTSHPSPPRTDGVPPPSPHPCWPGDRTRPQRSGARPRPRGCERDPTTRNRMFAGRPWTSPCTGTMGTWARKPGQGTNAAEERPWPLFGVPPSGGGERRGSPLARINAYSHKGAKDPTSSKNKAGGDWSGNGRRPQSPQPSHGGLGDPALPAEDHRQGCRWHLAGACPRADLARGPLGEPSLPVVPALQARIRHSRARTTTRRATPPSRISWCLGGSLLCVCVASTRGRGSYCQSA